MPEEASGRWTPGPWRIHDEWPDEILGAGERGSIAEVRGGRFEGDSIVMSAEAKANVRLIVASPALYDALRDLLPKAYESIFWPSKGKSYLRCRTCEAYDGECPTTVEAAPHKEGCPVAKAHGLLAEVVRA